MKLPPDWSTQIEEITCPLCGYNLRGLAEPRCPECGYRFAWSEVLDRSHIHPFLFEHHPERNFRSFWRTLFAGLNPIRFWRSVLPTHEPKAWRIVIYWVLGVVLMLGGVLGAGIAAAVWEFRDSRSYPSSILLPTLSSADIVRTMFETNRGRVLAVVASLAAILAIWPWLTVAILSIFRISMRRARVRQSHVLRCVIYSFDGGPWAGLIACLGFLIVPPLSGDIVHLNDTCGWIVCIAAILWFIMSIRLAIAYRNYLKFDHPIATVAVAQFIAVLTLLAILL